MSPMLSDLAESVAAGGIGAVLAELPAVLSMARRQGVADVLVRILADPAAPAVARERAFGRVAAAIASAGRPAGLAAA
jgi:hypothetical protein